MGFQDAGFTPLLGADTESTVTTERHPVSKLMQRCSLKVTLPSLKEVTVL